MLSPSNNETSSPKQLVLKNSLWLYASNFISRALKFFLVIAAGRILGPGLYGTFNYALYLVGLPFMFSDLGLSPLMIREYQKPETDRQVLTATTYYLKLGLIVVAVLFAAVVFLLIHDPIVRGIYFLVVLLLIVNNLKDFLLALAQANNRMKYQAIGEILEAAVVTALGLEVLVYTHSLWYFSFVYLIGALTYGAYLVAHVARLLPRFRLVSVSLAKRLIRLSPPFLVSVLIASLFTTIDVVMIKWFQGVESVGYYAVGLRIIQVLFVIPGIFVTALYPVFSRYVSEPKRVAAMVQQATSAVLMSALPLMFGGIFLGRDLIATLFSYHYQAGALAFQILLLMLPLYSVTTILDTLLFAFNEQARNVFYTGIAAGANVILNFMLIKSFGIAGVASSTILAQGLNLILTYRLSQKITGQTLLEPKTISRYLIAAGGMVAALWFFSFLTTSVFIQIPLGVLVYGCLLILLREQHFIDTGRLLMQSISSR